MRRGSSQPVAAQVGDVRVDRDGVDPFTRRSPVPGWAVRLSGRVALALGMLYLSWRIGTTLDGAEPIAATLLLVAELLGLIVFAGRVRSASATPIAPVEAPDAPRPTTTAVIDATGRSGDELRTTLVSTYRVSGLDGVVVFDREGSRWLRTITARFGATMADPDMTLMETVATGPTPWVLRMQAGDLPMPDLLTLCAAPCSAPDMAVVQLGIEAAEPTSYEYDPSGRWSLDPFDHQVVRPSLASRGSIPWYGDGPVMVRSSALSALAEAGAGGETDLESSEPELGVALLKAGHRVSYVPLTLARVRGPRTLAESLARRRARLGPLARVAFSRDLGGLGRTERVAHRLAGLPLLSAFHRLASVATLVVVMGFAQQPLVAPGGHLLVIAGPAYLLRWAVLLLLGRGRLGLFSVLRSDLRSIEVDLTLFAKGPDRRRSSLVLLLGMGIALSLVVSVTAFSVWRDWSDRLPAEDAAVALLIAGAFLGAAIEVLLDAAVRYQRRAHHRVRLGLVTCRLGEFEGQVIDLSTGGAGVVLACPTDQAPEPGTFTTIAFRIPDADGAWRNVSTLVHISHRAAESPTETRLGLAFDDSTDEPLDQVVEFLTIDRRLVALGRRAFQHSA